MRIIAGQARGRKLVPPPDKRSRPTSDRVKEATFNALGSLGLLAEASVLDLFAGVGSLGLEALSRGASEALFVESDRSVVDVLQQNVDAVGLGGRVVSSDALGFIRNPPKHFDLALLDPPYEYDEWDLLLELLPASVAVIESDREVEVPPAWTVLRSKKYGSTVVTIVQRPPT